MFAAMGHDDMSELKTLGEAALEDLPDDPVCLRCLKST